MSDKKDYWSNICEINRQQTEKGIKTYGQRLEDNVLPNIDERIRYLEEELVDALKYAEWIKDCISTSSDAPVIEPEKDKYRWHDLKKNPKDLPTEGEDVICCIKTPRTIRYMVSWQYNGVFIPCNNSKVLAWKYFGPYEVEE